MIKLGECELDYPSITRFKVWVGKENMGEYTRTELLNKFGDKWLDYGVERGGERGGDTIKSGRLSQNTLKIKLKVGNYPKISNNIYVAYATLF